MGDNNEEISLSDIVVGQLIIANQNKLIVQLMQQIAEMRVEMQRRQDDPPGCTANAATDGRTPFYFPYSNIEPSLNPPSTPT